MKYLRKRTRLDLLVNQKRLASPVAWGKRIYLVFIGVFGLCLLNYAVGDALFLRADGIVLTDRYVAAATYAGKVRQVNVKEGDKVQAGADLLELDSAEMLKDISELSARASDLWIREDQLRNRSVSVAKLLPLAARHERESKTQVARFDSLIGKGLLPASRLGDALGSDYGAATSLADLQAQADSLTEEIDVATQSRAKAQAALNQFERFYNSGVIQAGAEGVVGARVPVPGQVVKFGDELLQINGSHGYVLAYLPEMYLFEVKPGDLVSVTTGSHWATATIKDILTVADALPAEFQNMFRPRDRGRLIRIDLPKGNGFAISQKVSVRTCRLWCL